MNCKLNYDSSDVTDLAEKMFVAFKNDKPFQYKGDEITKEQIIEILALDYPEVIYGLMTGDYNTYFDKLLNVFDELAEDHIVWCIENERLDFEML